jgi:hypothetical protein
MVEPVHHNIHVVSPDDLLLLWRHHANQERVHQGSAAIYVALVEAALLDAGRLEPQLDASRRAAAVAASISTGLRRLDQVLDRARAGELGRDADAVSTLASHLAQLPDAICDTREAGLETLVPLGVDAAQRLSESYLVQRVAGGLGPFVKSLWRTGSLDRSDAKYPTPQKQWLPIMTISERAQHVIQVVKTHRHYEIEIYRQGKHLCRSPETQEVKEGASAMRIARELDYGKLGLDTVARAWLISRGLQLARHPDASAYDQQLRAAAVSQSHGVSLEEHRAALEVAVGVLREVGDVDGVDVLSKTSQSLSSYPHPEQKATLDAIFVDVDGPTGDRSQTATTQVAGRGYF